LHLHHDHSYVTPGMRERSMNQRLETIQQRRVRALCGLDQWLKSNGIVHLEPSDRCQVLK